MDVALDGNGQAQYTTDLLTVGPHDVRADYAGDGAFGPSDDTLHQAVEVADTDGVLVVLPSAAVAGQLASFEATFSGRPPSAAHPSGTVQFTEEDGTPIGPPQAIGPGGRAQLLASADSGDYVVRAVFSGNANFHPATASVNQHVDRADTSTTLTTAPNPVTVGGALTVKLDVAVLEPGDVALDGAVQMTVNGQPFGAPVDISGFTGLITTVTAPSTPQTGTIGAQYLGGANTKPSSNSLQQTVAGPITATSSAPSAPAAAAPTVGISRPLAAMTTALRHALVARGLGALGSLSETFTAPSAGKLEQQIFTPSAPRTALAASARPVRIATAVHTFAAPGAGTVKFKVTAAGRRAIHRARSLKLSVVTRFTPRAGAATRRVDRFTVKTKPGHRGRSRLSPASISLAPNIGLAEGADLPRRYDSRQWLAISFVPSARTIAAWRIP